MQHLRDMDRGGGFLNIMAPTEENIIDFASPNNLGQAISFNNVV
jgi:hypothetical protein